MAPLIPTAFSHGETTASNTMRARCTTQKEGNGNEQQGFGGTHVNVDWRKRFKVRPLVVVVSLHQLLHQLRIVPNLLTRRCRGEEDLDHAPTTEIGTSVHSPVRSTLARRGKNQRMRGRCSSCRRCCLRLLGFLGVFGVTHAICNGVEVKGVDVKSPVHEGGRERGAADPGLFVQPKNFLHRFECG